MDLIPSQIDEKTAHLNENGQADYLLGIIAHCIKTLPDLTRVSGPGLDRQIEPVVSLVKYLLLTRTKTLSDHAENQAALLAERQQEIAALKSKNSALEQEYNAADQPLSELKDRAEVLGQIEKLAYQLHIPGPELETLAGKFKTLEYMGRNMDEVSRELVQCADMISGLEDKIRIMTRKKQETITMLRERINEV